MVSRKGEERKGSEIETHKNRQAPELEHKNCDSIHSLTTAHGPINRRDLEGVIPINIISLLCGGAEEGNQKLKTTRCLSE